MIRGYVPQGAGFYTRYYVYVIQWQRALVVYMSLGQFDIWLCYLSEVSTPSGAAGRSRRPEKRYIVKKQFGQNVMQPKLHPFDKSLMLKLSFLYIFMKRHTHVRKHNITTLEQSFPCNRTGIVVVLQITLLIARGYVISESYVNIYILLRRALRRQVTFKCFENANWFEFFIINHEQLKVFCLLRTWGIIGREKLHHLSCANKHDCISRTIDVK